MFLSSRISSAAPEILVAFLVFSLSSGVVGGVLLYLDSAGPDVLTEMSEEVLIDMQVNFNPSFYEQNQTTIASHKDLVLNQEFVSGAEAISILEINDQDVTNPEYARSIVLGIESSFKDTFQNAIDGLDVNIPLNDSNCYVQNEFLLDNGLKIGENYTISVPTGTGKLNRSFIIAGTFDSELFMRKLTYDSPRFSYLYIILNRDTLNNEFSSLGNSGENSITDRIWVSFDARELVTGESTDIVTSLRNIEKQLEQRMLPDASIADFSLIRVFYEYSTWATGMRIIALAFSIPSVIMGIMLIHYNSNLNEDEQRRNVGTLKTRGATGFQATKWILSMSILTGIFGSLGALLTGLLSAILAGGVRELMVFDFSQISSYSIVLIPSSIVVVFLYSFFAGLLVTIPVAMKAYLMSPADAHSIIERNGNTGSEKMSNPVFQFAAVGFSGVLLIPLIDGLESISDLTLGSAFLGMVIVILLTVFIIGLTFLLARPSASFKAAILLRVKRPSLVVGSSVLGKNAKAFKRSEGVAVVFISLVFTAGIFSALAATTGSSHMKDLFMFDVGADVVAEVKTGLENVTLAMVDQIRQVNGVSHAAGMIKVSTRIAFQMDYDGNLWPFNSTRTVYGIEPTEWAQSAFLLPYFTYYNDPVYSIDSLEDSNENIITNFQPVLGYEADAFGNSHPILSDHLSVEFVGPSEKTVINATIVDVMAAQTSGFKRGNYGYLGYYGNDYLPGEDIDNIFAVMDIDNIHQALNVSYVNKIYIKLEPGTNYTRVMEDIGNIAPSSFADISSPYSEVDAILDSRAGQVIYGAYTLNVIFSIMYLTAGITLVVSMKVRSMRKHFSLLRALGAQQPSIVRSILIDSLLSVVFGAIVGGVVGTLLTLIILRIPLSYLGLSTSVSWDGLPLALSIPIPLVTGIILSAVVFSLLSSYVIIRRGLESNIAMDIQHAE